MSPPPDKGIKLVSGLTETRLCHLSPGGFPPTRRGRPLAGPRSNMDQEMQRKHANQMPSGVGGPPLLASVALEKRARGHDGPIQNVEGPSRIMASREW